MKSTTILKNKSKYFKLSFAVIAVVSLMTSCTVDEIETEPTRDTTTIVLKEKLLQRGDSLQYTGKPIDSLPNGDIIPPIKNTPPPPPTNP